MTRKPNVLPAFGTGASLRAAFPRKWGRGAFAERVREYNFLIQKNIIYYPPDLEGKGGGMLNKFRKWLYGRMALNNMTAGRPDNAEKWYRRLEKLEPESLAILHNLGVIYLSLKKFDEAEKYLNREIRLFGESEIRCRVLGDLYYVSGRREKAARAYGKALSLLREGSGNKSTEKFLRRRIKLCGGVTSYEKAMESMMYYEEGLAHYSRGDYAKALDMYQKAVVCDNSSYMALNAAGTLLMNSVNDYDQARSFFRKALELADMPLIRSNLALAERRIKESGGEL